MSLPDNINRAPPPSSFDDNPDFFEESRWAKFRRRLIEEPLIPLGCGLTCWALWEASRSIRTGDKYRTNRMFRRRIYAQGFTILAMLAGSAYWEGDRKKRREYQGLVDEKTKKERQEKWIRELEAREEEEEELRRIRDDIHKKQAAERRQFLEQDKRIEEAKFKEDVGQPKGGVGAVKSALEAGDRRGPLLTAVEGLWEQRR